MREGKKYQHFTVKYVEYCLPKAACPKCGSDSPRNSSYIREPIDVGLESTILLRIKVSVHKCPMGCEGFSLCPPFIKKGYHYTNECISKCIDSVVQDNVSINQTVNRVGRDFNIYPVKSTIWRWLNGEATKVKVDPSYEQWVVESFSGVACVDELYDGRFAVIFMTDPITDTIVGRVVKEGEVTQEDMRSFLLSMKGKGINVKLLITDESQLYADDILKETLPSAKHGLCNFHLIKNITKSAIKGVKKIRDEIEKQIPKLKKGRPNDAQKERAEKAKVLKEERKELFTNRYLLVKRPENLTEEEKRKKERLIGKHKVLADIGACMILIYELFDSKRYEEAKQRYECLIRSGYATNEYTESMVARIKGVDKFEKAFVHLRMGIRERTTNHVERENRMFRKIQKSCNKLRKKETIENRIDAQNQKDLEMRAELMHLDGYQKETIAA